MTRKGGHALFNLQTHRFLVGLVLAIAALADERVFALARTPGGARVVADPPPACFGAGDSIVVLGRARKLLLCSANATVAEYDVALGQGGLYKFRVGDRRTPVGTYRMGRPSASPQYYRRIPIEFPNETQRQTGYLTVSGTRLEYSGFDLLIHGPSRALAPAGQAAVETDWTDGCVALATDAQIDQVIAWYTAHPHALLHIVDERGEIPPPQ